ncbi:MAG: phosphatase PAP2 family protein [Clostridia bacterium]|nr:phosphatase PAP2 family protein [Clostridia bacterium]
MSSFAQWLNTAFAGFDHAILGFYHKLATVADPILSPIAEFFAVAGDGAMAFFILAAILLLFAKTRKSGICMAISIGIAALVTNVTVKPLVARPRPYASGVADFVEWWEYVGAHVHSEYSFPSGHTTSAMAAMLALCLCLCLFNGEQGKKNRWVWIPAMLCVLLMGASRNYIMVHYPSDIIGGIIAGAIGAYLGFFLIYYLYKALEKHRDNWFCNFLLEADVKNLFSKKN